MRSVRLRDRRREYDRKGMEMMMSETEKKMALCVGVGLVWVTLAIGEEYEISRYTIDGGGVMFSTGGEFELNATIGQPDAGEVMFGGDFELTGGFWFQEPPTDCNSTGGVDLLDHDDFQACLSGPAGGLVAPECNCFDVDNDTDVDLLDSAQLQQWFIGG